MLMPDVSSFEIFLHLLRYIITALSPISVVFWKQTAVHFSLDLLLVLYGTDFQNCDEANSGDLDSTINQNSNVAFAFVK